MKNRKRIIKMITVMGIPLISYYLITGLYHESITKNDKENRSMLAMYIQDDSGNYSISNSKTFPTEGYSLDLTKSSCQNGGTLSQDNTTKAISLETSSEDKCTLYFKKDVDIIKLIKSRSRGTRSNFTNALTVGPDVGVYETQDDDGTSYYLTGAQTTNYIKFADFYWRIIRVNGDGSLRIIYDGTTPHANGEYSEDRVVGYTVWGNGYDYGSSTIRTKLEIWYENNITNNNRQYIQDTHFINETDPYGSYNRQEMFEISGAQPNLLYSSFSYDFSVSNKNLDFPVGLITADEAVLAGSGTPGKHNTQYYLYKGVDYWTMTFDAENGHGNSYYYKLGASNIYLYSEDSKDAPEPYTLAGGNIYYEYGFAPVINLTPEYVKTMHGSGTMADPYTAD